MAVEEVERDREMTERKNKKEQKQKGKRGGEERLKGLGEYG